VNTSGSLAITTRPRGDDWLDDDIAALQRQGIEVLVSLLGRDEARELGLSAESTACKAVGLEFLELPVPDFGTPDDPLTFVETSNYLVGLLRSGKSVAVHCRQGIGRSGLLAVSILLGTGVPLKAAMTPYPGFAACPCPKHRLRSNGYVGTKINCSGLLANKR
jgi:hypothetical protein